MPASVSLLLFPRLIWYNFISSKEKPLLISFRFREQDELQGGFTEYMKKMAIFSAFFFLISGHLVLSWAHQSTNTQINRTWQPASTTSRVLHSTVRFLGPAPAPNLIHQLSFSVIIHRG